MQTDTYTLFPEEGEKRGKSFPILKPLVDTGVTPDMSKSQMIAHLQMSGFLGKAN